MGSWDYHKMVPKDPVENLRFRQKVIRRATGDPEAVRQLKLMCSRDLLFHINVFGYTFNPNLDGDSHKTLPFITHPGQDRVLLELNDAITKRYDRHFDKSREAGGSWLICSLFEWRWHWRPGESFLLISRKEEYVDAPGNPKTLFWKVDFLLKNQPAWLRPRLTRTHMHMLNLDIDSTIDGESTNQDVGVGDRRTAVGLDEFSRVKEDERVWSQLADTTKCRIPISTPLGTSNKFHDLRHKTKIARSRLHWSEFPEKAAGLYTCINGKVEILDKSYVFPPDYKFQTHGKTKYCSPWFDAECERRAWNWVEIFENLEINYEGSAYDFFPSELIARLQREYATPPVLVGEFSREGIFTADPNGRYRLWINFDPQTNKPQPTDQFAVSSDVSMGTGASNSVVCVGNKKTGEKVLEFASPHVGERELADIAVMLAKVFNNAYLIWESNGPGKSFSKRVKDLEYSHVYYKAHDEDRPVKATEVPGWFSDPDEKRHLLEEYRRLLQEGVFCNRSAEALGECKEYEMQSDRVIAHKKSVSSNDPSGAKANHGDRVIADALLSVVVDKAGRAIKKVEAAIVYAGSLEWRRQLRRQKGSRRSDGW